MNECLSIVMQWQYNYNNIAHLLNVYAASAVRDRYAEHFQKALNTRPDNIMIRMLSSFFPIAFIYGSSQAWYRMYLEMRLSLFH